jgi:hypothetical protein
MIVHILMPFPKLKVRAFFPDEFEDGAKHPTKARDVTFYSIPKLVHWREATSTKNR